MRKPGEATLDRWTAVHLASGFALGKAGVPFKAVVALLVGYEVFEAYLRSHPETAAKVLPKGFFEYESERNILADIGAGLIGYHLSQL